MFAPVPDGTPAAPSARSPWPDRWVALALFAFLAAVFVASPVTYVTDSQFSLLLSESLLSRGTFVLDRYGLPRYPPAKNNAADVDGPLYQIEVRDGHLFYYFPPGTSVLSLPFVAVLDRLGLRVLRPDGTYGLGNEARDQVLLAAGLMAALGATFFFTARLLLPVAPSLALALGGTLGTQIWSTASRGLWTHTWGVLLLGVIFYLLLAVETGRRRFPPVAVATLLSWTYFVRPTNAVFILGVTVYVLLRHRRAFAAYALTGAGWFAAFVAWSWGEYGQLLPSYYRASRLGFAHFGEAFAGNLVSPSRGLLVVVPATWFVGWLLVRYRRGLAHRPLLGLVAATAAAQLVAVAGFTPWNGGGCFGPRYSTELVPGLLLAAVLGVAAGRRARPAGWNGTRAAGAALGLLSVAIQAQGALDPATADWNAFPVNVDRASGRVWDWRTPQMLAGIAYTPSALPRPEVFPPLAVGLADGRLRFGAGAAATAFQGEGWRNDGPDASWTVGPRATLRFAAAAGPAADRLRLELQPFLYGRRLRRQRVTVSLNGAPLGTLDLTARPPAGYALAVPPGAWREHNTLTLDLPDATSPHAVRFLDRDLQRLGVRVYWLALDGPGAAGSAARPDR